MAWHRNNASHVGPMEWRGTEITPYPSTPWGGVAASVLRIIDHTAGKITGYFVEDLTEFN